jgi:hypothetical protein
MLYLFFSSLLVDTLDYLVHYISIFSLWLQSGSGRVVFDFYE